MASKTAGQFGPESRLYSISRPNEFDARGCISPHLDVDLIHFKKQTVRTFRVPAMRTDDLRRVRVIQDSGNGCLKRLSQA